MKIPLKYLAILVHVSYFVWAIVLALLLILDRIHSVSAWIGVFIPYVCIRIIEYKIRYGFQGE